MSILSVGALDAEIAGAVGVGLEERGAPMFEPGALSCNHWPSGALELSGRYVP